MPLDDLTQTPLSKGKRGKATDKPLKGKDTIVINPTVGDDPQTTRKLSEEKESTAVFAFGRFNPPTTGHEKLIHKVHQVAKEHDGQAHIVASHSENTSKDPLPQDKKLHYLKKVAPEGVHVSGSSKSEPSFLHAAKKLHDAGHKHLVMVAGSDRVDDYHKKLHQYNGKEGHYNFKSIKVVSAGQRDPDAEGVSGMSGTKMRAHARAGEMDKFKSGLPKALHPHADEIANHIRSVKEENLDEAAADIRLRTRRHWLMKRLQPKLRLARRVARQKITGIEQMKRRAYRQAKNQLRSRSAGGTQVSYHSMIPSEKYMVDKKVDDKVKLMQSLVKRLMPRIKQSEIKRLEASRAKKRAHVGNLFKVPVVASFDPNTLFEEKFNNKKLTLEQFEKINTLVEKELIEDKAVNSLFKKATTSEIPFSVVVEVYTRGINSWDESQSKSAQQVAFERVNSFINGGAARELDNDLLEGLKDPKDNPCWKGFKPVGTKMKKGKEVPNCVPEETQLDEISKETKMRYVAKAASSTNEPKEGEKQSDYLERLHKRMSGIKKALGSTNPSQRFQKEEHGAGEEGTDKLVKKYKKDTPCQENFMDGKNPEDKGDMARHGLKGKSLDQLKKVRSSEKASPRAKQLAHWFINMQKGKK